MPTLFRLLVILGFLAGLGYAGMFALATVFTPEQREMSITIPADRIGR
ncbi:MAG: histidine kinase [Pseudochelatococcus sp.]|jgi:hypothetical protein